MQILTKKVLRDYGNTQHHDVAETLLEWFEMTKAAEWQTAADVPARYVGNNRYVFNIMGNRFHLIVRIFFQPIRCTSASWAPTPNTTAPPTQKRCDAVI